MSDCMSFPKEPTDFIKGYSFVDSDEVYTNGSELVPLFRVEQMLEHYLNPLKDKEEQGLLIELPVAIGGTVWGWEYPTRTDEDGTEWIICDRRKAKVVPKKFHLMMLDKMGDMYFKTEAEAEEALAKMGGKA